MNSGDRAVKYQVCWERNWERHIADLKANDREWIREDTRLEALLVAQVAIETELELAALERLNEPRITL